MTKTRNQVIRELTLLLIGLTSWEERGGLRGWKNLDFDTLDDLAADGLIYRAEWRCICARIRAPGQASPCATEGGANPIWNPNGKQLFFMIPPIRFAGDA